MNTAAFRRRDPWQRWEHPRHDDFHPNDGGRSSPITTRSDLVEDQKKLDALAVFALVI
jgi:hypothetical protein